LKISIITVCYNNEKTIADTLKSVNAQESVDVEHILIDGGSTDNTLSIIKQYQHVSKVISEPDHGIYDAMNKGIRLATGDIIGTLNADDFFASDRALAAIQETLSIPDIDACYGDLVYVKENNIHQVVRYWESREYQQGLFKSGWMPPHPTFYAKSGVYKEYGLFDLNYQIAADVELLFRLIEKNEIKTRYIPSLLVKMRLGGTTNKNLRNIWLQNQEIIKMLKTVYPNFSSVNFFTRKFVNRAKQFFHHQNK